jgi:hypothetical protein
METRTPRMRRPAQGHIAQTPSKQLYNANMIQRRLDIVGSAAELRLQFKL